MKKKGKQVTIKFSVGKSLVTKSIPKTRSIAIAKEYKKKTGKTVRIIL